MRWYCLSGRGGGGGGLICLLQLVVRAGSREHYCYSRREEASQLAGGYILRTGGTLWPGAYPRSETSAVVVGRSWISSSISRGDDTHRLGVWCSGFGAANKAVSSQCLSLSSPFCAVLFCFC